MSGLSLPPSDLVEVVRIGAKRKRWVDLQPGTYAADGVHNSDECLIIKRTVRIQVLEEFRFLYPSNRRDPQWFTIGYDLTTITSPIGGPPLDSTITLDPTGAPVSVSHELQKDRLERLEKRHAQNMSDMATRSPSWWTRLWSWLRGRPPLPPARLITDHARPPDEKEATDG